MPSLIANYKEKEIITKAKKDYSVIMQAFSLAQADSGTLNDYSTVFLAGSTSDDVAKELSKYITGGYLCLSSSNEKLCKDLQYRILYSTFKNKYGSVKPPAIILPDNGVLFVSLSSYKCVPTATSGVAVDSNGDIIYNSDGSAAMWYDTRNNCGSIVIDVNGAKNPNKFGYDAFGIEVFPDRVGKNQWNVYGADSLYSILSGGKLKYNNVKKD